MPDPDLRLSDDEDGWLDLYEVYLAHWLGVFRQPVSSARSMPGHLFIVEFSPQAQLANGSGRLQTEISQMLELRGERICTDGCYFGLAYPAQEAAGSVIVRSLIVVHPETRPAFEQLASSIDPAALTKVKHPERGAADETVWIWLTDQLRASMRIMKTQQPDCVALEG